MFVKSRAISIFSFALLFLVSSLSVWAVTLPQPLTQQDYQLSFSPSAEKVELGKMLFWDKILSGNKNIACASCHHPLIGSGDGLSLAVGEGGEGSTILRTPGEGENSIMARMPRNAMPLYNLGVKSFTTRFHDGRVEVDPDSPKGFRSPFGDDLPQGMDSTLAVQALMPVMTDVEMAGQFGENPIADAVVEGNIAGPDGVWDLVAKRLRKNAEYVELFTKAYQDISEPEDITFKYAANAIAAYETVAFRADNSRFDAYLRGNTEALSPSEVKGMLLFYGKANCASCHSGKLMTDQKFHAIAIPQIGPGKGVGFKGQEDFGRFLVTGKQEDKYRFRTAPLRNVALTGPWGHSGAYTKLRDVVEHHLDPIKAFAVFDAKKTLLPKNQHFDVDDFLVHDEPSCRKDLLDANELEPIKLASQEVDNLVAFLHALTDLDPPSIHDIVPTNVPSGLTLND